MDRNIRAFTSGTMAVIAASLFVSVRAAAQADGGSGGNLIILATHPAIQKELALEENKAEKVSALADEMGKEIQTQSQSAGIDPAAVEALRGASESERLKKLREMRGKINEFEQRLDARFGPKLREILSEQQFHRLQQIHWQAGGSLALEDSALVKALDLTKDQQEKIKAINEAATDQLSSLVASSIGTPPDEVRKLMPKIDELTKERNSKARAVLTDSQQKKLDNAEGKPFDLNVLRMPSDESEKK